MKLILTISFFCASSVLFGQKTTLVVNQETEEVEIGSLNGFYVSETYTKPFETKRQNINLKEKLFMEFDYNYIRIVQLNISNERALELYKKDRLFNPKLTIVILVLGGLLGFLAVWLTARYAKRELAKLLDDEDDVEEEGRDNNNNNASKNKNADKPLFVSQKEVEEIRRTHCNEDGNQCAV